MEYSDINLYFDKSFTLEQIPDECIINMLDFVKYRLTYIHSND